MFKCTKTFLCPPQDQRYGMSSVTQTYLELSACMLVLCCQQYKLFLFIFIDPLQWVKIYKITIKTKNAPQQLNNRKRYNGLQIYAPQTMEWKCTDCHNYRYWVKVDTWWIIIRLGKGVYIYVYLHNICYIYRVKTISLSVDAASLLAYICIPVFST